MSLRRYMDGCRAIQGLEARIVALCKDYAENEKILIHKCQFDAHA